MQPVDDGKGDGGSRRGPNWIRLLLLAWPGPAVIAFMRSLDPPATALSGLWVHGLPCLAPLGLDDDAKPFGIGGDL